MNGDYTIPPLYANEQVGLKPTPTDMDDTLDRDAFLQLLVTQLRYQNPINPMSNEQFISQSAEFSSLEQMRVLNTNVQALIDLQRSSSRMAALNLIGKRVVVQHSTISLSDRSPVDLSYSISEDADVTITIYDVNGNSVRTVDVGHRSAGDCSSVWDGLDDEGIQMPDGSYSYKVSAIDADGKNVNASEVTSGVVDGLILEGEPHISIGGFKCPLWAVTEVSLDPPED